MDGFAAPVDYVCQLNEKAIRFYGQSNDCRAGTSRRRPSPVPPGADRPGPMVVVVGSDPEAVGALVREVVEGGGRASGFVCDPSTPSDADALTEMVAELFQSDGPSARR